VVVPCNLILSEFFLFSPTDALYRAIKKDGLNFVRLYFLNYTRYVNDLHNNWKRRPEIFKYYR